jgi:hypothetical protein
MAPSGIEPATSRFVAQCLSQLRHPTTTYVFNQLRCIYIFETKALCVISGFRREVDEIHTLQGHYAACGIRCVMSLKSADL